MRSKKKMRDRQQRTFCVSHRAKRHTSLTASGVVLRQTVTTDRPRTLPTRLRPDGRWGGSRASSRWRALGVMSPEKRSLARMELFKGLVCGLCTIVWLFWLPVGQGQKEGNRRGAVLEVKVRTKPGGGGKIPRECFDTVFCTARYFKTPIT